MVEFDVSYPTAGVKDLNYRGVGSVIDSERGLIIVDRDTVPVGIGDIEITFADTIRVPGNLTYLHPTHNFAVIRYEPSLLGDLKVTPVRFSTDSLEEGDKAFVVGLDGDGGFVGKSSSVDEVVAVKMLPSGTRFRDANLDVLPNRHRRERAWRIGGE